MNHEQVENLESFVGINDANDEYYDEEEDEYAAEVARSPTNPDIDLDDDQLDEDQKYKKKKRLRVLKQQDKIIRTFQAANG